MHPLGGVLRSTEHHGCFAGGILLTLSHLGAGTVISLDAGTYARRRRWRQPGEGKPWRGGSRTASTRRLQMP